MENVKSKSAVIRAKYSPDVKGVNRYKYFHRPLIVDEMGVCGESIDSKKASQGGFPQHKGNDLLPPINQPNVTRSNATVGVKNNGAFARRPSTKKRPGNRTSKKAKANTSKNEQAPKISVTPLSSKLPPINSVTKRLNSTWPENQVFANKVQDGIKQSHTRRARSVGCLKSLEKSKKANRPISALDDEKNKDFGTQTENSAIKNVSPESNEEKFNTPKATQTNDLPVLVRISVNDIEQRSKLLEVVEEALDQTIDKDSRERVNELITSGALKQAEIWRDVKQFMSTVLLPQSVAMANRARSKK